MNFDFSPDTQYESPNSLVPANTLSFAKLKVRGIERSKSTGGRYGDIELILMGRYENRRVWPVLMDPSDQSNSEAARTMGMAAIQHICEACGLFKPDQPDSYQRFANAGFADVLKQIDGTQVAIKVGVEKGTNGYQDKNRVLTWLTPNPNSSDAKLWHELVQGDGNPSPHPENHGMPAGSPRDPGNGMGNASHGTPPPASGQGAPDWLK